MPKTTESIRQMEATFSAEIEHYQKCLSLIGSLHHDVLVAGLECFEGERNLALWLSQPARALGGEIPLFYANSEKRRTEVIRILGAIDHGVYL